MKGFTVLKRPAKPNPPPENRLQGLQKQVKNNLIAKQQPLFPLFIDPRGGADVKEKVEKEMLLGKNVKMVKPLGFQDQKITLFIDQK